jgi:hypothetical protein
VHVSNDVQMHRNGRVMMIVGVLGLLAALGWLLLASEHRQRGPLASTETTGHGACDMG